MSAAPGATVVVLAITCQHPLHDTAHIVLSSFDQQMHMISHQAIRIKEEWESPLLLCQKRKELFVVGRGVEYLPAIIATRDHVIQTTFNFHPRAPGHGKRMLVSARPRRQRTFDQVLIGKNFAKDAKNHAW